MLLLLQPGPCGSTVTSCPKAGKGKERAGGGVGGTGPGAGGVAGVPQHHCPTGLQLQQWEKC